MWPMNSIESYLKPYVLKNKYIKEFVVFRRADSDYIQGMTEWGCAFLLNANYITYKPEIVGTHIDKEVKEHIGCVNLWNGDFKEYQ